MTRDVVTVFLGTSLMDIRKRLQEEGSNHLLVLEDGKLRGVISDRDVLRAIGPFLDTYTKGHRDVETLAQPASEIMQPNPITVAPATSIEEASQTLLDNRASSLPVVDDEELVGLVTEKDMLEHYISAES